MTHTVDAGAPAARPRRPSRGGRGSRRRPGLRRRRRRPSAARPGARPCTTPTCATSASAEQLHQAVTLGDRAVAAAADAGAVGGLEGRGAVHGYHRARTVAQAHGPIRPHLDRPLRCFPVTLDRSDPRPLGVQLADQVRRLVLAGTLAPGTRLPSTRRLAADLGVSRAVAEQAWDQLRAEGWLEARQGSGSWVSGGPGPAPPDRERRPRRRRSAATAGPPRRRHPVDRRPARRGLAARLARGVLGDAAAWLRRPARAPGAAGAARRPARHDPRAGRRCRTTCTSRPARPPGCATCSPPCHGDRSPSRTRATARRR